MRFFSHIKHGGDLDGVLEHDDAGDDERENKDGGDEDVSCESSAGVEMNHLRNSQRTTILCHEMMPCLRIWNLDDIEPTEATSVDS